MKIIEALSKLFELENPIDEARKKLLETFILIDDKPVLVISITDKYIEGTIDGRGINKGFYAVKSIDFWLPSSGLYPTLNGEGAWLLIKKPLRQWLRSFKKTYYDYKFIGKEEAPRFVPSQIVNSVRCDIFLDKTNKLWFWDRQIGYIKFSDGSVVCLDSNFKQEIIDWCNKNGRNRSEQISGNKNLKSTKV